MSNRGRGTRRRAGCVASRSASGTGKREEVIDPLASGAARAESVYGSVDSSILSGFWWGGCTVLTVGREDAGQWRRLHGRKRRVWCAELVTWVRHTTRRHGMARDAAGWTRTMTTRTRTRTRRTMTATASTTTTTSCDSPVNQTQGQGGRTDGGCGWPHAQRYIFSHENSLSFPNYTGRRGGRLDQLLRICCGDNKCNWFERRFPCVPPFPRAKQFSNENGDRGSRRVCFGFAIWCCWFGFGFGGRGTPLLFPRPQPTASNSRIFRFVDFSFFFPPPQTTHHHHHHPPLVINAVRCHRHRAVHHHRIRTTTTGHGESLCETTYLVGGLGTHPRHSRRPGNEITAITASFQSPIGRFYQTNSIPIGSCSRDITRNLNWSADPHATWKHLEQQCQALGISQRFEAYMEFLNLRHDGKDITTFCQQYQVKLQRGRQLGIPHDDDLVLYPFIQEITPYFEAYAVLLGTQMGSHTGQKGTTQFTLDPIVSRVLKEARQPNVVFNTRAGKGKSTRTARPRMERTRPSTKTTHARTATSPVIPTRTVSTCTQAKPQKTRRFAGPAPSLTARLTSRKTKKTTTLR